MGEHAATHGNTLDPLRSPTASGAKLASRLDDEAARRNVAIVSLGWQTKKQRSNCRRILAQTMNVGDV